MNFSAGHREPWDNVIALIDVFGDILLARDNGASAEWLWTTDIDPGDPLGTEKATTAPVIDDVHGYIYVGASDGKIYQLDSETGALGPVRTVSAGDDVVELVRQAILDPPLYVNPQRHTTTLLAATELGDLARFCTPFIYPPGTLAPDGDINMDGIVDAGDVVLAMQTSMHLRLLTPDQFGHGDVHPVVSNVPMPDGEFDFRDSLAILRKALGLTTF